MQDVRLSTLAINVIIAFCNCIIFRLKYQLVQAFAPGNLCEKINKMKTQKSNRVNTMAIIFTAILINATAPAKCQEIDLTAHSTAFLTSQGEKCDAKKRICLPGKSFYGDFNLGISNYSMAGEASVSYRSGNGFFTAGFYKSHICYSNDFQGVGLWDAGGCTNHITIESYSFSRGIILPGKFCQSISAGISLTQFTYIHTTPVYNDFGLSSFWEMVTNSDYDDGVLNTHTLTTIGVPLEYKIHILSKHFAGIDASARMDINPERIFTTIMVGIRLGKISS
jgi:hypothetical protein